jgi:hypothetical protein
LKLNYAILHHRKLVRSKVALALPLTFLILFVSTLGIVAFTYYFSVEKLSSQGQTLKVSTAKQNFISLNEAILSTLCQPGSSATFELSDSGGLTNIQPASNVLTITISDSSEINELIFNASIGKVTYEFPYSDSAATGLYLKGDSRTITNQSGSSTSQMCIVNGIEHPEIRLRYRPTLTYATGGLQEGRTVNNIRIYIVNLNSSASIASQGRLPLKISCTNTQLTTQTYQVDYQPENLVITSVMDGDNGSVLIPISSTATGAVIYIETVISNISIERWIR